MSIKDFSRPTGRRLRIPCLIYEPPRKNFRTVKGMAALVTVEDAAEHRRLWAAIEDVIAEGKWKNGDSDRGSGAAASAVAHV
jgi:hypothetical protein